MEGTRSIPTRYRLRVKQRLAVVEYVKQHGIKLASRQFGLARPTVRQWFRNWQRAGIQGLVPQYPARRRRRISDDVVALITQARREHEFGASRTRIWLERVHHVRVALFEKERPGDSVQVAVKGVVRGRKKSDALGSRCRR